MFSKEQTYYEIKNENNQNLVSVGTRTHYNEYGLLPLPRNEPRNAPPFMNTIKHLGVVARNSRREKEKNRLK